MANGGYFDTGRIARHYGRVWLGLALLKSILRYWMPSRAGMTLTSARTPRLSELSAIRSEQCDSLPRISYLFDVSHIAYPHIQVGLA